MHGAKVVVRSEKSGVRSEKTKGVGRFKTDGRLIGNSIINGLPTVNYLSRVNTSSIKPYSLASMARIHLSRSESASIFSIGCPV